MRIDPEKPVKLFNAVAEEHKVSTENGLEPEKNYRQIAAIILVFVGVFYFFFKVVF